MLSRVLKLSIAIVFYIVRFGIVSILSLFKKEIPGTIVILTYHSVKNHQRHKFEAHMDYLVKAGKPVFSDIIGPLSPRMHHIAVTFDDGFQSVLKNALTAMGARDIPATIFVTTGYIGKKPGWTFDCNDEDTSEVLLTQQQLKQLPADLVTIGSHTSTHQDLSQIDEGEARRELVDSKRTLEKILNRPVKLLSFPHGAYNKKIIEMSGKANYERIFSNIPDSPSSKIGKYLMGRITITPEDWKIEYRLKFLGAYQWLPWAIKVKQKLKNFGKKVL